MKETGEGVLFAPSARRIAFRDRRLNSFTDTGNDSYYYPGSKTTCSSQLSTSTASAMTSVGATTTTTPSAKAARQLLDQVCAEFNTDEQHGLRLADVSDLRAIYGWNELDKAEEDSLAAKFAQQFTENPLILLLLGSALVSLFMGQMDDAISITMVSLSIVYHIFVINPCLSFAGHHYCCHR